MFLHTLPRQNRTTAPKGESRRVAVHSINRRSALFTGSLLATLPVGNIAESKEDIPRVDELTNFINRLEHEVQSFRLPNGLSFVVLPRHSVPVVAFSTVANVGAFDEDSSMTGVAHFLEHMAFKGTSTIGTTDNARERRVLAAQDEVFAELCQLRANPLSTATSGARRKVLEETLAKLVEEEASYTIPNEYAQILRTAGGVGLNAQTGYDITKYFVSLPSNKAELWFAMESARFMDPVFRQLFNERQVILEERRLRVDNSPYGTFFERFQQAAFGNNYRRPVIGYESHLQRLSRSDLTSMFESHYNPWSMAIAIVGDITAERAEALATKYFGDWSPASRLPSPGIAGPLTAATLPQSVRSASASVVPVGGLRDDAATASVTAANAMLDGDREIVIPSIAGPAAHLCYYRPAANDTQASAALDVLSGVLSGSRNSRLYQQLVRTGQSLGASCSPSFPSDKHECAMLLSITPTAGTKLAATVQDSKDVLERLTEEHLDDAEISRVKLSHQVGLAHAIRSNTRMASILASYQAMNNDWTILLTDSFAMRNLTADQILSAAQATFGDQNSCTVLMPWMSRK